MMERARDQKPWFGEIIFYQIWETDLGCPHDIIIIILVHLRDRAGVHSVRHGPPPVRLAKEWIPRFKYSYLFYCFMTLSFTSHYDEKSDVCSGVFQAPRDRTTAEWGLTR